ncbi:MAG: transglutaminase domain-containing protein [Candidatus Methylacidiphilales bacterium]
MRNRFFCIRLIVLILGSVFSCISTGNVALVAGDIKKKDADSFIAGRDVVLVTGIPGDISHEKQFGDNIMRFMEVCTRAGSEPRHLYILSDEPDSLTIPTALKERTEVQAASRTNFMALADKLKGRQLLVILWGHGGLQGKNRVYHMRGPRLIPEDLKAWAAAAATAPDISRWVLYFPGSSSFAQALVQEKREILSSDADSQRDETIGWPLAVDSLSHDPVQSFADWCKAIGVATNEWFENQDLVPSEAPTLWKGTAKPVAMLPPEDPKSKAKEAKTAKKQEKNAARHAAATPPIIPPVPHPSPQETAAKELKPATPPSATGSASPASEAPLSDLAPTAPPDSSESPPPAGEIEPYWSAIAPTSSTTDPVPPGWIVVPASDAWAEVKPVDPKKYPDNGAVALLRRGVYVADEKPSLRQTQEAFIQILTQEGMRAADFTLPNESGVDFKVLDAEIRLPNGLVRRLANPSTLTTSHMSDGEDEEDDAPPPRIAFPGAVPGAVLHIKYEMVWDDFPMPQISMDVNLGNDMPSVSRVIEVRVPSKGAFHYLFHRIPEGVTVPEPITVATRYAKVWRWTLANMPANSRENLAPEETAPVLLFSTFPDWKDFSRWYWRLIQDADRITPEIVAKAKEVTKDAKTDRERVIALFNFVTRMRYVAVPMGVNSHRPHAAANVLANNYGDCKDKANLLNTLIRSLKMPDVEAHIVLVPRMSQAFDNLPGLAFNHAISRIKVGQEIIWADSTDDNARFGLLPPGDPGRKVLVIDGKTMTRLDTLPSPQPANQVVELRIVTGPVDLGASTDAAATSPATLELKTQGIVDYLMRSSARRSSDSNTPDLWDVLRPANAAFSLATQKHTPALKLDAPFTWSATGRFGAITTRIPALPVTASGLPGAPATLLRAPILLPEWGEALHDRTTPLFLNEGFPLTIRQESSVKLTRVPSSLMLPALIKSEAPPLKYSIEWKRPSPDTVVAQINVELETGEMSMAQTLAFQTQYRALLQAVATPIVAMEEGTAAVAPVQDKAK